MKIIEAMKAIKALLAKAEDLKKKIGDNCANLDIETAKYANPVEQVNEWLQSHSDTLKEILRLRINLQYTNLKTSVAIKIDGKSVIKTIAEWIHRRRDLATSEQQAWERLGDRGLREGHLPSTTGAEPRLIKIVRHFDSKKRDERVAAFRAEPHEIDATLEVVNATTELMEI